MKVQPCIDEISEKSFEEKIKKDLVVVDFFAEWCMPCLMLAPILEELAEKYKDKMMFCKVNVDDNSEISHEHDVMSVPTIIIFKDGKEIDRITGNLPSYILEEKFDNLLNNKTF